MLLLCISDLILFHCYTSYMYDGSIIYAEVPTLYQACLRVLMDNVDGKFRFYTWQISNIYLHL